MKLMPTIPCFIGLLLLLGCSEGPRPPAEVKAAVKAGLAEIDQVDGGAIVMNESVLMIGCLPRVRAHWEEAEVLLNKSNATTDKFNNFHGILRNALGLCWKLEAQYVAGSPFASILETSEFRINAKQLAQAFGLEVKPPRQATDAEPWFSPEKLQIDTPSTTASPNTEIKGLFGLNLGQPLPGRLVRKVGGWREMAQVGAYCVTPPTPWDAFDIYSVELLADQIHKINASRNGRGQTLINRYESVKKELITQFGSPTSTGLLDTRADDGIAWEQSLRTGGRVRMTLALRKDLTFASGAAIPGHVMLEIQTFTERSGSMAQNSQSEQTTDIKNRFPVLKFSDRDGWLTRNNRFEEVINQLKGDDRRIAFVRGMMLNPRNYYGTGKGIYLPAAGEPFDEQRTRQTARTMLSSMGLDHEGQTVLRKIGISGRDALVMTPAELKHFHERISDLTQLAADFDGFQFATFGEGVSAYWVVGRKGFLVDTRP